MQLLMLMMMHQLQRPLYITAHTSRRVSCHAVCMHSFHIEALLLPSPARLLEGQSTQSTEGHPCVLMRVGTAALLAPLHCWHCCAVGTVGTAAMLALQHSWHCCSALLLGVLAVVQWADQRDAVVMNC